MRVAGHAREGHSMLRWASELQLQPELHDASIHAHCADFSERARARDITGGIGKIWVIEKVKDLPAEKQVCLLAEFSAFDQSDVEVPLVGPSENIPSQVSKDRSAPNNRKLSIDQTSIGNEWRRNKYARVEELIDPAADATVPRGILQGRARCQVPRCEE